MPQSRVSVVSLAWSDPLPVTSGAKVRVQNIGGNLIIIQAFPNTNAPAADAEAGGLYFWSREGWWFTLAEGFPGVTTPTHLRVYAPEGAATVSISQG